MASLALTGASLWRAMSMRDRPAGCASCASRLCGALCGSGRPPRGGRRRSFVVANVCWWRTGDAGGAADRRRAIGAARAADGRRADGGGATRGDTGSARQRGGQHDTRRHTATSARQRARPTRHSPPHGDIDADDICCCGRRPRRAVQLRGARQSMVLKNQRKGPALTLSRRILARARARARRWRRELGGGVRQHPGSNNCVEGAYGIARFDRREPVESDEHARSTCGVRELRQPPVRRSVRQRAAAARRPTSIVCWWRTVVGGDGDRRRIGAARRRESAPRRRRRAPATTGTARQRAANTTLAATRRHPRGSVRGQHDTRRHTATSMLMIFAAAAAGRAARFSYGVLAKAWC